MSSQSPIELKPDPYQADIDRINSEGRWRAYPAGARNDFLYKWPDGATTTIPVMTVVEKPSIRTFDSGSTRDTDTDKLDYFRFFSAEALEEYAEYMHTHRFQADGVVRDGDNWKKGIPLEVFMSSLWRHFMDLWFLHLGLPRFDRKTKLPITKRQACCAILFNTFGYLHETIKADRVSDSRKCQRGEQAETT